MATGGRSKQLIVWEKVAAISSFFVALASCYSPAFRFTN